VNNAICLVFIAASHSPLDSLRLSIDPTDAPRQACGHFFNPLSRIVIKKTKDAPADGPAPDLEKSLAELEKIVERLEAGDLSLDDSLKQFERGIALTRHCQTALRSAEQKVEILLRKSGAGTDGSFVSEPFDTDLGDETP
jgi:exodeoxyribonuclease VII small subunit